MGKTIVVFNQKGGVGKTTTCVNLAASIAKLGKKVLIIDADPQGNSTSGVGVSKNEIVHSLYSLISHKSNINECIVKTGFYNLFVLPSNIQLSGAEIELVNAPSREIRMKKIVEKLDGHFDYILIDCPPSLGLLSINALAASDSIIIPIQCEYYALEGLGELLNTYNLIKKGINQRIKIEGVVLTMYDARTNLSEDVSRQVEEYFKGLVYETRIPRSVKLAEAPSRGKPVIYYDINSAGAKAYESLAKEILSKNR